MRDDLEIEGSVHPRVGQVLLDEGSWCEHPLMQDYLAGVLASARSPDGGDDRGLTWAKLVTGLSSVQIRAHYVLYSVAQPLFSAAPRLNYGFKRDLERHAIWIPRPDIDHALDLADPLSRVLDYAMRGLHATGLVGKYAIGFAETLRECDAVPARTVLPDHGGVIYVPSTFGMELFLWAHGFGASSVHRFSGPQWDLRLDEIAFEGIASACLVADLPRTPISYDSGEAEEE